MDTPTILFTLLVISIIFLVVTIFYINKNSKLKLKRNKNKFSKLFESSNDIILILNESLSVVGSNKSAKKIFGKKIKNNNSFLELFDKRSAKTITDTLEKIDPLINDLNVDIINVNNRIITYSLSLVKWKEKKQNHYGMILKDLTIKLTHQSEEKIIAEIYKISETNEDQFSFLHEVLLTICKTYKFDLGQVWVKNKNTVFYLSNDLKTERLSFKTYSDNDLLNQINLFNNSKYRIEPIDKYNKSDLIGISETQIQGIKTIITVPIVHLDLIPVSFLLFSKNNNIRQESISGLFNILALIGEINHKKNLAQELRNNHILLSEAEKISGSGSWSINISGLLFNHLSEGFKAIYELENHKNLSLYTQVIDEDLEKLKEKIEDATTSNVGFFIEYRIIVKNRIKYIHMRGIPKYDLNKLIIGYHGSIADVSMLKEKNLELETVNIELEALNENLEQFTYIASHDLQEPLRKIQTFGNLLKEKYESEAPGYEYIIRMQKASERMQRLIQDLLDYSRVSRSNGNTDEINFNDIVKEILENFSLENVYLKIDKLPILYPAYRTQILQLFQNLISNAIKFKRENIQTEITISYKIENIESKKYHEIIIKDNGIGFDTQYADKIFDMFQRLHSKNEFPGTGIGLAICKKIVENHDGFIKVNSTLGVGSVFKIYLPIIK